MKPVTIVIRLEAEVDSMVDASMVVGYVLDSGVVQDAIAQHGADHGHKINVRRAWHDVTQGGIEQ